MSGVLACVFLGLTVSYFRSMISPSVEKQMENVWVTISVLKFQLFIEHNLAFFMETLIFLIAGLLVGDNFSETDGNHILGVTLM